MSEQTPEQQSGQPINTNVPSIARVSEQTLQEIFNNPYDLLIVCSEHQQDSALYWIEICRGSGDTYKTLISSNALLQGRDQAVLALEITLRLIKEQCIALGQSATQADQITSFDKMSALAIENFKADETLHSVCTDELV